MLILHHLPNTLKDLHNGAVFVTFSGRVYSYQQVGTERLKRQVLPVYGIVDMSDGKQTDLCTEHIRILPHMFYNMSEHVIQYFFIHPYSRYL